MTKGIRRLLLGCAGLMVLSGPGLGQPGAINGVTTVAPVTSVGMAPVPDVGDGAPLFSIDELSEAKRQALAGEREAEAAATETCRLSSNRLQAPRSERFGSLSFEALYNTEEDAQATLIRASEAAQAATEKALAARTAAANGTPDTRTLERTELERQTAVNAFVAARGAVAEARARISDLYYLVSRDAWESGEAFSVGDDRTADFNREHWNEIFSLSRRRAEAGGAEAVVIPSEYQDLRLFDVVVREQFEGDTRVMVVSGKIGNQRTRAIRMPPLSIVAVDQQGFSLKTEQIEAQYRARIEAGENSAFVFALKPMPANAATALVTFLSSSSPVYPPPSLACFSFRGQPPALPSRR